MVDLWAFVERLARVTQPRIAVAMIAVLPGLAPAVSAAQPQGASGFAELAEKQIETVVNISTTQAQAKGDTGPTLPQFPPGSPFDEFFKHFQDRLQHQQRQPVIALGSGFIIDPSGYVVTNGHVVSDAQEISVILHDETILKAKIVGTDPLTDLALLKVEAGHPLIAARWGNSDAVRIGDWVVAIGNPFGLGGTVTAGILSARHRDIHAGPYDEFLQTDAAINRGNSGGPLFNLTGEVIGVNTAIFSPSGGSVGIGFAIPSALAKGVIDQLRLYGKPRRGWLGVQIQQVTEAIAESLGLDKPTGALVTSVTEDGPAAAAGIRQGDVITGFQGHQVDQMRDLPRLVADTPIGSKAEVTILRDHKAQTVAVQIGELPVTTTEANASTNEPQARPKAGGTGAILGLTLAPLTPNLRESYQIPERTDGVVVTNVAEDSPAANEGFIAGDVIVEISQEPVSSPTDVTNKIEKARREHRKNVLVLMSRQGDLRYVPLPLQGKTG
jgi:serine protease Do